MYGMQVYNVYQKAYIPTSYTLLRNLIRMPFFHFSREEFFIFVLLYNASL